jgi:hypothetical protein
MPFGESFLSTIKSNKSIMLDKTRRFRKTSGGFDWSKSQQFNFPKATPQQLEAIKQRIQLENKKSKIKQIVAIVLIMLILMATFIFYTS